MGRTSSRAITPGAKPGKPSAGDSPRNQTTQRRLPGWLDQYKHSVGSDKVPEGADGFLAAVIIGQSHKDGWFDALSNDDCMDLLGGLAARIEEAAPGTPKLFVTPAGTLELARQGDDPASLVAPLARRLPERVSMQVGVDSPWTSRAEEQAVVPVHAAGPGTPRWKLYPAPTKDGWEPVPHARRSYRFEDRIAHTHWGKAWPAVCHDIFAVKGLAAGYEDRVGPDGVAPAQLEAELPRPGKRSVTLILNSVHRFVSKDHGGGHFGRFPAGTAAACRASGAATISAAVLDGFDHDTSWSAGRARGSGEPVEADAHWWVEGPRPTDWVWLQIFRPRSLGL